MHSGPQDCNACQIRFVQAGGCSLSASDRAELITGLGPACGMCRGLGRCRR